MRGNNTKISNYADMEAAFTARGFNRRDQEALRYVGRWDINLSGYRDPVFNSENIRRFLQLAKLSDPIFDEIYKIADKAQKEMLRYSHTVKVFFVGEDAYIQHKMTGHWKSRIGRTLSYADRMQLIRIQNGTASSRIADSSSNYNLARNLLAGNRRTGRNLTY